MDRGLRAQLSPKEDTVLRKIAAGADAANVPRNHLTYLESLWLIESRDGKWELTDVGKTRIAADPN